MRVGAQSHVRHTDHDFSLKGRQSTKNKETTIRGQPWARSCEQVRVGIRKTLCSRPGAKKSHRSPTVLKKASSTPSRRIVFAKLRADSKMSRHSKVSAYFRCRKSLSLRAVAFSPWPCRQAFGDSGISFLCSSGHQLLRPPSLSRASHGQYPKTKIPSTARWHIG